MVECTEIEVVGPTRHHAIVVRALEEAGLTCQWLQPSVQRSDQDDCVLIQATGPAQVADRVVEELHATHPTLRVRVDGDC